MNAAAERVAVRLLARGKARVQRTPWERFGGDWRYCYDVYTGDVLVDSYFNEAQAIAVAAQINANRAAQGKPVPANVEGGV